MEYNNIHIDDKKLDAKVLKEYLNALDKVLEKYPKLINRIDFIGDFADSFKLTEVITKFEYNSKTKYSLWQKTNYYMTSYAFTSLMKDSDAEKIKYVLLCINEKLNYDKVYKLINNCLNKNLLYASNIEQLLYHEVGHMFSGLFKLIKNEDFFCRVFEYMRAPSEEFSSYSLSSFEEFIAEHFSKYLSNPTFNEPTEYIGNMIDKYYDIYSDTNVLCKSNDLQLIRKPKSK